MLTINTCDSDSDLDTCKCDLTKGQNMELYKKTRNTDKL